MANDPIMPAESKRANAMKLYTRGGDKGQTSLCDGRRVNKDDLRISAYGEGDELNAAIGLVRAGCDDAAMSEKLRQVQDRLFVVGAELANPDAQKRNVDLTEADVTRLESWIDEASDAVAPLKSFILPGGGELAARLHLARGVCRRTERTVVRLAGTEQIGPWVIPFLNRLSDLLFVWARLANRLAGLEDVVWRAPADHLGGTGPDA